MATIRTLPRRPLAGSQGTSTAAGRVAQNATFRSLAILVVMTGAILLGLLPMIAVPAVAPASAPADRFSAERAMEHMNVLAARPHPMGSPEQAEARDYLLGQITSMGLQAEVQRAVVVESSDASTVGAAENVLVRLPGREAGKAVLITGHYDTVPTSPGAADCISCVATVLESLRVLNASPQLKNDVIFLFTDGEEVHTKGAQAFARQHPWAKDVALSIVYEGYGSSGADILYSAGDRGGWLAQQALSAGGRMTGYSFMSDIMGMLGGSSSDLEAFLETGAPGLAFIALSFTTVPGYHTYDDNLAKFDPRTLQSHGDNTVALVRRFGEMSLSDTVREPNGTFFPLLPGVTLYYPSSLSLPLAIVALALFLGVLVLGAVRRRISLLKVLAGALCWLLALTASVALVTVGWILLRRLNPNLQGFRIGFYDFELYFVAFLALTAAIMWGLYALARRRLSPAELGAGALVWCAVFGVLLALALPGVSYVTTWPLIVASLVAGWSFTRPAQEGAQGGFVWLIPAALAVLLIAPLVSFLAMLSGRMEALTGVPLVALPLPFALLALGLALPLLEVLPRRARGWLAAGALVLCVGLLVVAIMRSAPSVDQPAPNAVIYQVQSAEGAADSARWIAVNDSRGGRGTGAVLDAWTSQFFPNGGEPALFNPWTNGAMTEEYPVLTTPAPVVTMARGGVTVESVEATAGGRRVRLHVAVAPQVLDGQILLNAGGPINDVIVAGQALDAQVTGKPSAHINFHGRFDAGIPVEFTAPASGPVSVTLNERTQGLPAVPGLAIQPRPANMSPAPFNFVTDSTLMDQLWTVAR
ncbi:MAG: M20/M25/M40 family metallo-hydrolase [Nitrososphaerales archaeon]